MISCKPHLISTCDQLKNLALCIFDSSYSYGCISLVLFFVKDQITRVNIPGNFILKSLDVVILFPSISKDLIIGIVNKKQKEHLQTLPQKVYSDNLKNIFLIIASSNMRVNTFSS